MTEGQTSILSYFPTTPITHSEEKKAGDSEFQRVQILNHMVKIYPDTCTAEDLYQLFPMLLTSVRARLTVLERHGKIKRIGWVKGQFGVNIGNYQAIKEVIS